MSNEPVIGFPLSDKKTFSAPELYIEIIQRWAANTFIINRHDATSVLKNTFTLNNKMI